MKGDNNTPPASAGSGIDRAGRSLETKSYRNARKLHNQDQVVLKDTGETGYVLSVYPSATQAKALTIEAVFPNSGYLKVTHLEVS